MNPVRNVYLNRRISVTHMKGAKMKKTLCLILLLFVFTAAKKDQPSSMNTYNSDSWSQPSKAQAAPAATPAGVPDAQAIEAAATIANNPGLAEFLADPNAVSVIANPGFVSLLSGSPEEVKARLDALAALAQAGPAVQAMGAATQTGTTSTPSKKR